jgi:ubiquinone/menaquinone biosynthesis C-methylase UbiE
MMHLDWRITVVEPDRAPSGEQQVRTVVGLGPAARQLIAALPPATKIVLGVEVGADGTLSGVTLPLEFARAAQEAGMQLRVDFVADGYQRRHVDFSSIHGVQPDDLRALARALDLRAGMRVLDLGCGYGAASAGIVAEADRRGIDIELVLCDLHEPQLRNVPPDLRTRAQQIVVADARDLPFPDRHFDSVVMKMVLHEVPIRDQPLVCEQVFRVLRPGGTFVVWQVMPQDDEVQDAFTDVMQLKNALAGYESIVRDRNFFRLDQLLHMLARAGFADARELRQVAFRQSTLARRDSELDGSNKKLAQLNACCRSVMSADVAKRVALTDSGDDIQFWVPNRIVAALKPR